ncbi:efflux RND transporter periplasmic adaptor subunit [Ramlibacter albus]|uniref:HlyD family efflux transporter periplasmic adaptor subunit n=1 Tax=Ramlibacter albus TaxID=2079448 RepID=A0A923M5I0_9BURK|nr:HlyD family efflux transporter periplasmic adaptor subunit [Ramlibacter albus]MBC5763288.1 HlyD family efflux transporter periplasmic adaptor subunit [Ramlibacter albus]
MEVLDPAQALLRYEAELVGAGSAAEAGFVAVNRLGTVLPFRLAVLLQPDVVRHVRVASVSHLAEVDENAPFAQWLAQLVRHAGQEDLAVLTPSSVPEELARDWGEWLPEHAVLCRLTSPAGTLVGWVLTAFDNEPEKQQLAVLQLACRQVTLVLSAWQGRGWLTGWRQRLRASRKWMWVAAGVLVALMAVPVRLSAVAPAEVTPLEPASIAAPIEGVLAKFHVPPNTLVKAGTVVASIDDTVVRNRHAMAQKALEISRAEFARAGSKSFGDDQSRSELLTLRARIDEKQAELAYTEELLERVQLKAPIDGLVTYSSPDEWVGRPLATGERIATIANPARVGLTLHLPADDAIDLKLGGEVQFHQNISPLDTLTAKLTQTAYETENTVDAGLAYVLKAQFAPGTQPPRLGLRGSAKVYGDYVPLGYYLLRRPFASARRVIGF